MLYKGLQANLPTLCSKGRHYLSHTGKQANLTFALESTISHFQGYLLCTHAWIDWDSQSLCLQILKKCESPKECCPKTRSISHKKTNFSGCNPLKGLSKGIKTWQSGPPCEISDWPWDWPRSYSAYIMAHLLPLLNHTFSLSLFRIWSLISNKYVKP